MDFVDWCGHVLRTVIEKSKASAQQRLLGINEVWVAEALFGEDKRTRQGFWESTQRHGMLDAVKELEVNGLLQDRGHKFYLPTAEGREVAKNPKPLWEGICHSTELEQELSQLLSAVNALSPKSADDHAWLERADNEPLLSYLGWPGGDEGRDRLWAVSKELEQYGFIRRDARIGGKIYLTSTYRGLVWETKRALLRRCDVFISHITEEKEAAHRLKSFLLEALGEDLRVFVSSDYRSIKGGRVWYSEIIESLTSAPVVLALLSETSVGRRWINFEAGVGIGSGSMVIPLVAGGFPKSKVGLPLSQLQVRSLDDGQDVEAMLGDIAERLSRRIADVDASGFVAQGYAAGGARLQATVNHVPARAYDGCEEHSLIIGLINNSAKTLTDYRVELEIPDTFVNQSTTYHIEVEGRRTAAYRFFRSEGKDHHVKTLRPGDVDRNFIKMDIVIPPEARESGALDQKIIVKVFAGDDMTYREADTVVRQT